jgi:hypothetical protein
MSAWGGTVSGTSVQRNPVISQPVLCKLIGWLGSSLPLVLMIGNWISARTSPPGSISGYYYTDMRNLFVSGLCALGVLLLAYRGHEKLDGLITDVAGACMILVALCPTKPPVGKRHHLTPQQDVVGDLHVLFAAATLIALGVMALRFAQAQRRSEVVICRACAAVIFSCVLLATGSSLLLRSIYASSQSLLIFEVLAMLASGLSWFVPGRAIMLSAPTRARASGPIQVSAPTDAALSSKITNASTS